MKNFLLVALPFLLLSCLSCNPAIQSKEEQEYLNRTIEPSLAVFSDTLSKLGKEGVVTIDHAVKLYSMLVPADSTEADSAAVLLLNTVQVVANKQTESFMNVTTDYSALLDENTGSFPEKQQHKKPNGYMPV